MMAGCKTSRKQITHVVLDTDVFYEILIRLSLKDVVRCKAVSKEWLSNISNPQFWSRRMAMALSSTSGLLCPFRGGGGGKYAFIIDLDKKQKAAAAASSYMTKSILGFIRFSDLGVPHPVILQSCNGLLLCSMDRSEREFEIYVYNPTTQRSRCIPLPPGQQHLKEDTVYPHHSPLLWSLAFDPRASHHYKVICLSRKSEILIYSSESGSWTAPALFNSPNHPKIWVDAHWMGDWKRSVFWNGSLHWIPHKYMGYYYHVDRKRLSMMPTLPLPPNLKEQVQGRWSYFGQSGEHLHLIWFAAHPFEFTVYEMERDYSTWSLRFCVDLAPVSIACIGNLAPIHILCVVEVHEGCCLLLHLPHKIIRYHVETQTTFELLNCPVADFAYHAFPFMESLAAV